MNNKFEENDKKPVNVYSKNTDFSSINVNQITLKISKVSEVSKIEQQNIWQILNDFNFVILDCEPSENPRENIVALKNFLGSIKWHKRSEEDGIVPVRYLPNSPGYLDTTNNIAPMHTDGSFEIDPPKMVALQCEVPSQNGGMSQIVHAQSIYEYLAINHPQELRTLFDNEAFYIERGDQIATHAIFKLENNKVIMIFRSETADASIQIKAKVKNAFDLIKDYVNNPKNQFTFKLKANQILVIDNTSILHGRSAYARDEARRLNKLWFSGKLTYPHEFQLGFTPKSLQKKGAGGFLAF